jgi:hypothetical protein
MLTLATIAERLHYKGRDQQRSVRRLFARHRVPMIKRGLPALSGGPASSKILHPAFSVGNFPSVCRRRRTQSSRTQYR